MACNASKTPFLRIVAARRYATAAKPAASCASEIHSTTLPNKLMVATSDSTLPISRVSVVFRAGSRNESYDNMGAAHMLKLCSDLSTKRSSAFAIARHLQQDGIHLSSASDREHVSYTITSTCDKIETGLKYLEDIVSCPAFKPWEFHDNEQLLRNQASSVPQDIRAVELMHRAAYRTGLGNSVYCPKYHIGKISPETMLHYYANTCTTNRCAIVGVGVDQNTLTGYAQNLELESGDGIVNAAKYHGNGEIRKNRSSSWAHVAVAGEGGSYKNLQEALAFAVLLHACGSGASTKRGNVNGSLGKAVSCALDDAAFKIRALNCSYADSGLFGFLISTDGSKAGKAVEAAVKALKSGSVSSDDIKRGKALLRGELMCTLTSDAGLLIGMGRQALLFGQVRNITEMDAAVNALSDADVQSAAKKVASSKLSMGAVGNLEHVPYISDLA